MKNIIKTTIALTAVGVAVFALQSSVNIDTASSIGSNTSFAWAGSTPSASTAAATAPATGTVGSIQGPALTTFESSTPFVAAVPRVEALAAAQPVRTVAGDDPRDALERKQQIAQSKMSGPVAALAAAGGPTPTEIIVSYADRPELIEDDRIEKLGGEIVRHYEFLELLAIRIPAESLIELAVEDSVDRLSLDEPVRSTSIASKGSANYPTQYSDNYWYTGNSVRVAVLDTGVAQHPDLYAPVWQFSFLNGRFTEPDIDDGEIEDTDPRIDHYGHGTHIAGLIAGDGYYSYGDFAGPAINAEIFSLQVLDENGYGHMSDVMAALDWLIKYGARLDIKVANLSLGKPITESNTTDPLVKAVEAVWDSGIVVAVAAGNYGREGYFSTTSPGNSRKVITVGSLTDNNSGTNYNDDRVSTYSSKGPTAADHVVKPDLVAPGNRLVSATPYKSMLADLLPGNRVRCKVASSCSYNYLELSGTSMSTGLVSATAALMLQKDPSLTPATIKARLMRSARKMDESPIVVGAGVLDIDAALDETGVVSGDALSPLMAFDEKSGGTLIQNTASLWGSKIWGSGYLWTDGVNANGYLWTDGVSANGYLWTDGGIFAKGFLWTDAGIAAFGYLWTDGVDANGYLWTDGVDANGYLWTDGVNAKALYNLSNSNPVINDDEPTSN